MNSDSENECLIEERSSDEEFSSSESESDDDCLDNARDWCQIDVTSPLPSHPKFPFTGNPGIKGSKMKKYEQGRDEKIYRSVAPTRRSTKTCGTVVLVEKTNSIHCIFLKSDGTFHNADMMEVKAKGDSVKLKPKAVVFYNNRMGGVDRSDLSVNLTILLPEINSENTKRRFFNIC
ncbi:uncharacterized protein TNCV_3395891 [Trichonephila clavipes]|nr:uncharacterized protein TNCV_3395891 [Trichonephila clavipes]